MNRRAPFLVGVARQTPRPRVDLELNRRLAIVCLTVAAVAAAMLAPLAASADAAQRLHGGMNLHLTGPLAVDRCTMAVPPAHATIAVEMPNAADFCELFSRMLADDVFHAAVLVTPGELWHYRGAAFSCRAQYRSTRERMTINNAPAACRWLQRHATGWRLEGASGHAFVA